MSMTDYVDPLKNQNKDLFNDKLNLKPSNKDIKMAENVTCHNYLIKLKRFTLLAARPDKHTDQPEMAAAVTGVDRPV